MNELKYLNPAQFGQMFTVLMKRRLPLLTHGHSSAWLNHTNLKKGRTREGQITKSS